MFLLGILIYTNIISAQLADFDGVTEVQKVTSSHPDYEAISQQYALEAYQAYEITYRIRRGWNFLPFSLLDGRDSVTGKASCWKQNDQSGDFGATVLEYIYLYEPNASILPNNKLGYYVGGYVEEWKEEPLKSYQKDLRGIPEPNSKMTLPINWVYSPIDCEFKFYTGWLDEVNYEETSNFIKEGNLNLTLEKGWQVILQLFPGFSWNEIKGDCIIEEINFWQPDVQVYSLLPEDSATFTSSFLDRVVGIEDYFKPIMMKIKDSCTLGKTINYSCEKVIDNGDSSQKIDLLYIPDAYNNLSLWAEDVDSINEEFFSIEPMKSNKNKFNVWRVDLLGDNLERDFEIGGFSYRSQAKIKEIQRNCVELNEDFDISLVVDSGTVNLGSEGGRTIYSSRTRLIDGEELIAWRTLVHEFGHFIANLGDEYENSISVRDFSDRPNIDKEGCPKWCSGELNTNASCYNDYISFKTCLYNVTDNLTSQYKGECNYHYSLPLCNLGVGCRDETGCYWNAKSIISFRSTKKSFMSNPDMVTEFNSISQEAILEKLNLLDNQNE
ncbi:hypothetical protein HN832_03575 [archaeon]|nr:hypothetical protein [archaeon]MBT4373523.1 hypothetical protein [archaeon]MBT4531971.1 hypothetical protein [archaeon]MBT7282470.1 hypothetical protein [archaeon]